MVLIQNLPLCLNSKVISSFDEDELEQKIKSKSYILTIQGNSKLEFYLKFSPREVQIYTFDLTLTLNRYVGLLSLTRQIICRGQNQDFLWILNVLNSQERLLPHQKNVLLQLQKQNQLIQKGNQCIGEQILNQQQLIVDALFYSSKSVQLTTKIEFYDEMGKVFTIPVSGTADNCLIINKDVQMNISQGQIFQSHFCLMDDDDDANSDIQSPHKKGAPSVISYRSLSSMNNQTTASALGYIPIPQYLVVQNKQYATKWLKFFLWSANIHAFPEGAIEQDGQPIFELTFVLSGKITTTPLLIISRQECQNARENISAVEII